jgi:GxxExxY protein
MALEHRETTGEIIGAAITVHRELGPGFIESAYENALILELGSRGIPFRRQLIVPVLYRGVEVALRRLDLFVDEQIVVELKAVREITGIHFAIVRSYLRAVGRKHGLILNFSKPRLEVKRIRAAK